jgi:hypothetical protein
MCWFNQLPFTLNMVLTAWNRHEIAELIALAETVRSRGVRFGHLMWTRETAAQGLNLSPAERRETERTIAELAATARLPVAMAPGYFSESAGFRCAPLLEQEYNVDYRGNLTLCCHLSGIAGPNSQNDRFGDLKRVRLQDALSTFSRAVRTYLDQKQSSVTRGEFHALDHFPCFYCVKHQGKAEWLTSFPEDAWAKPAQHPTRTEFTEC